MQQGSDEEAVPQSDEAVVAKALAAFGITHRAACASRTEQGSGDVCILVVTDLCGSNVEVLHTAVCSEEPGCRMVVN